MVVFLVIVVFGFSGKIMHPKNQPDPETQIPGYKFKLSSSLVDVIRYSSLVNVDRITPSSDVHTPSLLSSPMSLI